MVLQHTIAQALSENVLEQMSEKGYKGLSLDKVYNSIRSGKIYSDSSRMQFKLLKDEEFIQEIIGPNNEECWFFPRRVILNITTDYQPSKPTLALKRAERIFVQIKKRGFDSQYVCRCARENKDIARILQDSYKKGNRYSLMVTLGHMYGEDAEGRRAEDSHGDVYIRTPIILVPNTTPEERETLDSFCEKFEIPNKETQRRILGEID